MAYFNYHAKIKRLIKQGEFLRFEIVEEYNGIKPCMIIYFKNHKPMPVREHRFNEYLTLLEGVIN